MRKILFFLFYNQRPLFLFSFVLFAIHSSAQEMRYSSPQLPWQASLGNHRAVLTIEKPSDAVRLVLNWRLHRQEMVSKGFLIVNSETGDTIQNVFRSQVNDQECDIAFGPVDTPGTYYFYYMPYVPDLQSGYYRYDYLKVEDPDSLWVSENKLQNSISLNGLPTAQCEEIQSRTEFDSFFPMEIVPDRQEKDQFLKRFQSDLLLFPEDRSFAIRMRDEIPLRWLQKTPEKEFESKVLRNEYFVFQVGAYAPNTDIRNVTLEFSDLIDEDTISAGRLTCFNTSGVNTYGNSFSKVVNIQKGGVQALWIGIDVPSVIKKGKYRGSLKIYADNAAPQIIKLTLDIQDSLLADRGDSEPWRYSRLRWLNSKIGLTDIPTGSYTTADVAGKEISLSDKKVIIGGNALPSSVKSFNNEILSDGVSFDVGNEVFSAYNISLSKENAGKIISQWSSRSENFYQSGESSVEFDGYARYKIKVKALVDIEVKNMSLDIPIREEVARYMMGMGMPGSEMPVNDYDATWEGPHNSFWIGDTHAGLYIQLLGEYYNGPLLSLYNPPYPSSWYNSGKGGFRIKRNTKSVVASVYSGSRELKKGDSLTFEFAMIITPVKPLDTHAQFINRYFHDASKPWPDSSAVAAGIKVVNIHHGNSFNPYINYPFVSWKKIQYFSDYWAERDIKTKIYYTVRELTNHASELWALMSLDGEIFRKPVEDRSGNNGFPWLREHLVDGYVPAWYTTIDGDISNVDAAIETSSGDGRWYNFYVRGLAWLIQNTHIDGIYLDDVAFDRHIIKRMREVMDSLKPGCMIDLHSNTGFSKGPATQYTSFFPYIDKLWFGESFDYNKMPPANWLVESSGIPFGLMGDMLYKGGNQWRGMIYGMATRLGWETEGVILNPIPVWQMWSRFGIADAKMSGYWENTRIIETTDPDILVTIYAKEDSILISVASWASETKQVKLKADWERIGFNPDRARLYVPRIENFQDGNIYGLDDWITVKPEKGLILILKKD